MLGENAQQLDNGFVLFGRHDPGRKIGIPQFLEVQADTPVGQEFGGAVELGRGRFFAKDLAGLQEPHQTVAQAHGHGGFAQAVGAAQGAGLAGRHLRQSLLDLQARGAGAALLRNQGAKRAFVAPAVMGKLPAFHRAQGHRHPGRLRESPFVVLEDLRGDQGLDQAPVAVRGGANARLAGSGFRWPAQGAGGGAGTAPGARSGSLFGLQTINLASGL